MVSLAVRTMAVPDELTSIVVAVGRTLSTLIVAKMAVEMLFAESAA
jgi:hypothetical protein